MVSTHELQFFLLFFIFFIFMFDCSISKSTNYFLKNTSDLDNSLAYEGISSHRALKRLFKKELVKKVKIFLSPLLQTRNYC